MNKSAYLILRLAIGLSMFGHGLVRLPKLTVFSDGMLKEFEHSMLPQALVLPFSYVLPIAEFLVGLFIILGLFTKQSSVVGAIVMLCLIFGTCLIENFGALPSQLIHAAFFAILIQFIDSNSLAIDKLIKNRSTSA